MKYLVVIAAGLTDRPIAEKDNKTPLQLAETPNLDALVQKGQCGSVQTIPDNLHPGNEVSGQVFLATVQKNIKSVMLLWMQLGWE